MPTATEIIRNLETTVDAYLWLRILHHILLVLVAILLWRLRQKAGWIVSLYLTFAFFSVFLGGITPIFNPFYLLVFGILTLLGILELIQSKMNFSMERTPKIHIAIALIGGFIGFWYPHFVESPFYCLIGSPLGVIPCPTLIVALSLFLLAYPKTNRVWHWVITLTGLFFGIVGLFKLGVILDLALLALAIYSLYSLILLGTKKKSSIAI